MHKKTIFIGIAFGTSVRDFLRTSAFTNLRDRKDLEIVIFSQDLSEKFKSEFSSDNIFFEKLCDYKPNLLERLLLILHRALLSFQSNTIALGNISANRFSLKIGRPFAWCIKLFFGHYGATKLIGKLYGYFNSGSNYCEHFNRYQPDLLVVTRVLNYSLDYPLLKSAAKTNVPAIALVSSWDNLTSKAFFPYKIERLAVWNSVMQAEAVRLYGFDEERICVTGVPRYDLYFKNFEKPNRKEFLESQGLQAGKKTILYATGSGTTTTSRFDRTSPEADICMHIASEIRSGVLGGVQLVVRLHPQAIASHFNQLKERFPEVLIDHPGRKAEFKDRYFSRDDDYEYAKWLSTADMVINFGSTASVDAAVFDTPILCINFDIRGDRPFLESPRKIYHFDHYRNVMSCGGIALSDRLSDLSKDILQQLEDPSLLSSGRRRIVDQQCEFTDGAAGDRISDVIVDFLEKEL